MPPLTLLQPSPLSLSLRSGCSWPCTPEHRSRQFPLKGFVCLHCPTPTTLVCILKGVCSGRLVRSEMSLWFSTAVAYCMGFAPPPTQFPFSPHQIDLIFFSVYSLFSRIWFASCTMLSRYRSSKSASSQTTQMLSVLTGHIWCDHCNIVAYHIMYTTLYIRTKIMLSYVLTRVCLHTCSSTIKVPLPHVASRGQ